VIDRRGFIGALLALPFLRPKRWKVGDTVNYRPTRGLIPAGSKYRYKLAPMDGRISQAWVDYFNSVEAQLRFPK
jgi:hypothetical protein